MHELRYVYRVVLRFSDVVRDFEIAGYLFWRSLVGSGKLLSNPTYSNLASFNLGQLLHEMLSTCAFIASLWSTVLQFSLCDFQ